MSRSLNKRIQQLINTISGSELVVDGILGVKTRHALEQIFDYQNLTEKQIYIELLMIGKKVVDSKYNFPIVQPKMCVFVDAGHGGLDSKGNYMTAGKRAYHEGYELHHKGHYFEGYENRIIAEMLIKDLTKRGFICIRTYHPYLDWKLSKRVDIINSWLKRGYYGLGVSLHSNAIPTENKSIQQINQVRGACVFTSKGYTLSDYFADIHIENLKASFPEWRIMENLSDGDGDWEANFTMLAKTDVFKNQFFAMILEEFGYHSSVNDCLFITNPVTRALRTSTLRNSIIEMAANFKM